MVQPPHTLDLRPRPTHLLARQFPFLLDPRPTAQHRPRASTPRPCPFLQRVPHIFAPTWKVRNSQTVNNDSARRARHDILHYAAHERAHADRAPRAPGTADHLLVCRNATHRAAMVGQGVCRLGGAMGRDKCYPMGHFLTPGVGTWSHIYGVPKLSRLLSVDLPFIDQNSSFPRSTSPARARTSLSSVSRLYRVVGIHRGYPSKSRTSSQEIRIENTVDG